MNRLLGVVGMSVLCAAGLVACESAADSESGNAVSDTVAEAPGESPDAMSEQEANLVSQMVWVSDADPVRDAERSLASDEGPSLVAFSLRGIVFPGLSEEEYGSISNRVTYRVPEGAGDFIVGDRHRQLRAQLLAYAETYNRVIYDALK